MKALNLYFFGNIKSDYFLQVLSLKPRLYNLYIIYVIISLILSSQTLTLNKFHSVVMQNDIDTRIT